MLDSALIATITSCLALALASLAALKAWEDWLALRRQQLSDNKGGPRRSDLAELKHRIRTLEAIASGTDRPAIR